MGHVVNQQSLSLCSRGWCTQRRNGRESGTNCWSWPPVSHAHTLARTATPVEGNAHPHSHISTSCYVTFSCLSILTCCIDIPFNCKHFLLCQLFNHLQQYNIKCYGIKKSYQPPTHIYPSKHTHTLLTLHFVRHQYVTCNDFHSKVQLQCTRTVGELRAVPACPSSVHTALRLPLEATRD